MMQSGSQTRQTFVLRNLDEEQYQQWQKDQQQEAQQAKQEFSILPTPPVRSQPATSSQTQPSPALTSESVERLHSKKINQRLNKLKHLTVQEKLLVRRDQRILENWERQKKDWERIRHVAVTKLGRKKNDLVITKSEEYREKVELFDLLGKATPAEDASGGHSWYHSLRNDGSRFVRVGNIFSGLFLNTKTHSDNKVLEQIRKGWLKDLVDSRKNPEPGTHLRHTWRDSPYLINRLRKHGASMRSLTPGKLELDEVLEPEVNKLVKSDEVSEVDRVADNLMNEFVAQEKNIQKNVATVEAPDEPSTIEINQPMVEMTPGLLEFNSTVDNGALLELTLTNTGSSVVFFQWNEFPSDADDFVQRAILPQDDSQRFFCHDASGKLLPGGSTQVTFRFFSKLPGSFTSRWELQTTPHIRLEPFRMHAICTHSDLFLQQRAEFEKAMHEKQILNQISELVNDVVDDVKTVSDGSPDFADPFIQELYFEDANEHSEVFFQPHLYEKSKNLSAKILGGDSSTEEGSETEWDLSFFQLQLAVLSNPAITNKRELLSQVNETQRQAQIRPLERSPIWSAMEEVVIGVVNDFESNLNAVREAKGLMAMPFPVDYVPAVPEVAEGEEAQPAPEPFARGDEKVENQAKEKFVTSFGNVWQSHLVPFESTAEKVTYALDVAPPARAALNTWKAWKNKFNTKTGADILAGTNAYFELDLSFLDWDEHGNLVIDTAVKAKIKERLAAANDVLGAGLNAIIVRVLRFVTSGLESNIQRATQQQRRISSVG